MTLNDCYMSMGANYEDAIGRLRKEELLKKFVLKFLDDPSYEMLIAAVESLNREELFRAAHTIKGVAQNLGFTRLYEEAARLTEEVRNEWGVDTLALVSKVSEAYEQTVSAINKFKES